MDLSKNGLVGKTVMNKEGVSIGIIKKSLRDTASGEVTSILIEPSKEIDIGNYEQNRQGSIILPSDCVAPVQDVVIIENESLCKDS